MNMNNSKQPRIYVLGDLMLDHYIMGVTTRISPEAPVPVVKVENELFTLGGALNVANNLASLGAKVYSAGLLGSDDAGRYVLETLHTLSIDTGGVMSDTNRITIQKCRILASNQQMLRYDKEMILAPTAPQTSQLLEHFKTLLPDLDIIILSDYDKGTLTNELCQQIISHANQHGIKVLVDPKGKDYSKYKGAYLITPNRKETSEITGIEIVDDSDLMKAGRSLKDKLQLQKVVMTLGNKGMAVFDEELTLLPTVAQEVYDVTGAGDTVIAALAFGLADGLSMHEACRYANLAAAVVVAKVGCATATQEEIQSLQLASTHSQIQKSITLEDLLPLLSRLRNAGKTIVFTNGCFDVIHAGHVSYLQKAQQLGDVLIVGLNSDGSVKALKGPDRPINGLADRSIVLSGLSSVDFIVPFEEETPYNLIKSIQPDILVKGADYKGKEVIGAELVKRVELIEFMEGKSSTGILQKMNDL